MITHVQENRSSRVAWATEYEKLVTKAILTNDNDLWSEADVLSRNMEFTPHQLEKCHSNVERWLRLHGVTSMEKHEKAAVLLIQSCIRRWLIKKMLTRQYNMYYRLAKLDSLDHSRRAVSLGRTLASAWQHVHSR